MKKVAILCKQGCEEVEALTPLDVLRRSNIHVDLVGMDDEYVVSSHNVTIKMDKLFDESINEYDGVILPGGLPGATNLRDDERVIKVVQDFNNQGKMVAAICAGPIALGKSGVLENKTCTCFPGFEDQLTGGNYQEALVQVDGNIITGKGPAAGFEFSYTILEYLGIDSTTVRNAMQYTYLMSTK